MAERSEQEKTDDRLEKARAAADKEIQKARKSGLQAKVKDNYMLGNVTAFSGLEYVKGEWREVPPGYEDQVLVHPYLDVRNAETEEEITIKTKEVLASVQTTSAERIAQMVEPDPREQLPEELKDKEQVVNREVEPVGDTSDPTVREAKVNAAEEILEEEEKSTKRKKPRK